MRMSDQRVSELLLLAFAVHNIEEVSQFRRDLESMPDLARKAGPWQDRGAFAVATAILTAVAAACVASGSRAEGVRREILLGGPAAALVGNACAHIGRGAIQRRYNGGMATAPVMLALGVAACGKAQGTLGLAARLRLYVGANVVALPAILVALAAGKAIVRLKGLSKEEE